MKAHRTTRRATTATIVVALVVALVAGTMAATASTPVGAPMKATLAFIKSGKKPAKSVRIAYLAACLSNPYCAKLEQGIKDATAKWGASFKTFDAEFNPANQRKQVQDAIAQGFDGYILQPVAEASGCADFKLLKRTGKPVTVHNSPICGDRAYTKGAVGFVAMQVQDYFTAHVMNAFKSCTSPCEVAAIGGFVGSDLFSRWQKAIKAAQARYPKAKVVVNQPANFDPRVGLKVIQDGFQAHPKISVIISSWDDMTRGAIQAVKAARLKPGVDVRIYSVGGTKDALARIKRGELTETTVLLPYEESYYAVVHMIRKLATGKDTAGFTNLAQAPTVTSGPGTIFITKANAGKFKPEY